MVRWEPNAKGRLQQAAMALFFERGYDAVTVTDIAEHAGMTKGSFFNHFGDKPEVVFATLDTFAQTVVEKLTVGDRQSALDTTVEAFALAATELDRPELARAVRTLIDSSSVLQERERTKMAAAAATITTALVGQGIRPRDATFVANTATLVFTTAYEDWANDPQAELPDAIRTALADYRVALKGASETMQT